MIKTNINMYFDDIFKTIRPLWKLKYNLGDVNKTESHIEDLSKDWEQVDYIISYREKENYNDWDRMLSFVFYQVMTEFGIEQFQKNKMVMNIDDIPLNRIEKKFHENLKFEGNERYLENYKGFKK